MPRTKKTSDLKASPENAEWMKSHSREDLRALAGELSGRGEDVSDIMRAITDLEEVEAEEEEWERTRVDADDE